MFMKGKEKQKKCEKEGEKGEERKGNGGGEKKRKKKRMRDSQDLGGTALSLQDPRNSNFWKKG